MAIRINRVYTRAGDGGETSLVGGERVPKDSLRIEAFGAVDELNSLVGAAVAEIETAAARPADSTELAELLEILAWIQHKLFDLGAYLATPSGRHRPGMPAVGAGDVSRLEQTMDRWQERLEELKSFVLPGGGRCGAALHVSRAVCRRAEIQALKLHRCEPLEAQALAFLNRLSDCLFVAARHAARLLGHRETLWAPKPPA